MWAGLLLISTAEAAVAAPARPSGESDAIVITGERVPRSLKDTPSSVHVTTARELEAKPVDRVDQVLAGIPNVQLGNGSEGPSIRGQDTTGALQALPAFLGGNRPRTTLIVDGRPVTYNEFVFGTAPVWDVSRIEVFRSPQTTTQGQNSIAGAIFVNTNDPTFTPEYRARVLFGNFGTRELSAVASGPVAGSDVAFRLAGDLRYSRTTSRIIDEIAGADPNHDVYGLLRAKLLVTPAALPGTRVLLTYAHNQSQAPQIVGVTPPFRRRHDDRNGYGVFRIDVDSLTAAVRHDAGHGLTANLLLTAGDGRARRLAIAGFGEALNRNRDWSEAVLNWSPDGPLKIVGGVSHNHVALRQAIDLSLLSGLKGSFRDWQDGTGVFGEVSLALVPRLTLTAGLRYQRDRQKRQGALVTNAFSVPADFIGTFHAWLPKVSVAYDVTPQLRAGALIEKAYNPGGTTIRFDTALPDDFAAESLWDYEVFARGSFVGGRLSATANLFYYDMRDAQRAEPITIFTPTGRAVGFANLFNVPRAHSYGFEGELEWRPGRALTARLTLGLLGTRITRTDADSARFQGKQFDRSPHASVSASADWTPLTRLRLSAQVWHHSPYLSDSASTPPLRVGSATIVDARAQYDIGRAALFVQARNLFDTFALRDRADPGASEAEDPRQVMVGIETRF